MLRKICILMVTILIVGCTEDILDLKNPSEYDEATYYKTQKECQEAVIACYSQLTARPMYGRDWHFMFDLLTNQADRTAKLETALVQLGNFTYYPENDYVQWAWETMYRISARALIALEKVDAWETTTSDQEANKLKFLGEAHFFHAWAYYHLTELWGDVPYHETWQSIKTEPAKPRTSYTTVQGDIETHLLEAISLLPDSWDDANLGRITKDAARAYLGKLYLIQGKNTEARDVLLQIGSHPYQGDYYNLFTRGNHTNTEIIMQCLHKFWGWSGGSNSYYMFGGKESWGNKAANCGRHVEYGFNDWHNVYIPDAAVAKFTYTINGASYLDPRNQFIFYGDGTIGDGDFAGGAFAYAPYNGDLTSGYQWKKYCYYETAENMNMDDGDYSSIIVRMADVKLLLAEAYMGTGQYDLATALINDVRARVSADPYNTDLTAANAFEALKRERYIELFGEQHYWFDLVRWDRLGKLNMIDEIPTSDSKFKKFPIPANEKDTNPQMVVSNSWN